MRTCSKECSIDVAGGCPAFLANIPIGGFCLGGIASGTTDSILSPRVLFVSRAADTRIFDRDTNTALGTVVNTPGVGVQSILYVPSEMEMWTTSTSCVNAYSAKAPYAQTFERVGPFTISNSVYNSGVNQVLSVETDGVNEHLLGHNATTKALVTDVVVAGPNIPPGVDTAVNDIAYSSTENVTYVAITDNFGSAWIDIYNAAFALIDSIPLAAGAVNGMVVSQSANRLYFWFQTGGGNELRVYDCATNTLITALYVGAVAPVASVAADDSTGRIYVSFAGEIAIIDGATSNEICSLVHPAVPPMQMAGGEGTRIYFSAFNTFFEIYE